jgi:hypothetical protein
MEKESFENNNFTFGEPISIILMSGKYSMGYFMGEFDAEKGSFAFRNKDQEDIHELNISILATAKKGWY